MQGGKGVRLASGASGSSHPHPRPCPCQPSTQSAGLGSPLTMLHISDKCQRQQHRSQVEAEALVGVGRAGERHNEVSKEEALPPPPSFHPDPAPPCSHAGGHWLHR